MKNNFVITKEFSHVLSCTTIIIIADSIDIYLFEEISTCEIFSQFTPIAYVFKLFFGKCRHNLHDVHSDVKMAKKYGFANCYYPNVNKDSKQYRAYDMSPMIGGAYRGIVNNHLRNGLYTHSMEYEYGFVYGGLFVTGYCAFIHAPICYCEQFGIGLDVY